MNNFGDKSKFLKLKMQKDDVLQAEYQSLIYDEDCISSPIENPVVRNKLLAIISNYEQLCGFNPADLSEFDNVELLDIAKELREWYKENRE